MYVHLVGFIFMLLHRAQSSKLSKSVWIVLPFLVLMFSITVRSSTYFKASLFGSFILAASFARNIKMIGPFKVPCGTPPERFCQSDRTLWYLTHWDLLDIKSQIHGIAAGLVPTSIYFGIAMFWSTQSKALLKYF